MKNIFFFAVTIALMAQAQPGKTEGAVRFAALKRYEQREALPPKLLAYFDLECGEKILEPVRFEETGPDNEARIYLGALVKKTVAPCKQDTHEVSVEAGHTYSGRQFRIESIR
ncbi:MAG: hypothetical protein ACXVB9_15470 [Bdellovibrionota bacterium]